MAPRPQPRAPRAHLDLDAGPSLPVSPAPELRPAPDNGRPYGAAEPDAVIGTARARRGRQLGHRVPEDLARRLQECSEATGITQQRLLIRALDAELTRHGH